MNLMDDFIPDFTSCSINGLIGNKTSQMQSLGDFFYISLYNKINVWNFRTQELISSIGKLKYAISCFLITEKYIFIGYENGLLQIFENDSNTELITHSKLHTKKITAIYHNGDYLYSSSIDGSLICYDMIIKEIKVRYNGNTSPIEKMKVNDTQIFAFCSDKTLKIWNVSDETILDAEAMSNHLFDFVVKEKEILLIYKNGDSSIFKSKVHKPFERFKGIKKLKLIEDKLFVLCQKKMIVFRTGTNDLSLSQLCRFNVEDYVDFVYIEGTLFFLRNNNKISSISLERLSQEEVNSKLVISKEFVIDFGFHQSEILDIKILQNDIYSISSDRLIHWNKDSNLDIQRFIPLKNARCFEIFNNYIVVGNSKGLKVFNLSFLELVNEIEIENINSISSSKDVLGICTDSNIIFLDFNLTEIRRRTLPDVGVFGIFSPDNDLFGVSCLDCKVYIYNTNLDLKFYLYGHSLPVRNFSITQDSKMILTAGADKLIKIWGLDFGECRKSIVGNAKNVEVFENKLFVFCDKKLEYYNGFDKLRDFRVPVSGIVRIGSDFLVVSCENGLSLFTMNEKEFIYEECSSDVENFEHKNIASISNYDRFLDLVDDIIKDPKEVKFSEFYKFLENLDLQELREILIVLDSETVDVILKTVEFNVQNNIIFGSRLWLLLLNYHKDICLGFKNFFNVKKLLLSRLSSLRDVAYANLALFMIQSNSDLYDEI